MWRNSKRGTFFEFPINKQFINWIGIFASEQVVIFVKSVQRCVALATLLTDQNFPAIGIHRGMVQEERLSRYQQFKDFQKVRTNFIGSIDGWTETAKHIPIFCIATVVDFIWMPRLLLASSVYQRSNVSLVMFVGLLVDWKNFYKSLIPKTLCTVTIGSLVTPFFRGGNH